MTKGNIMWDENTVRRQHFDYPLLLTVLLLTGLGLTMVFSASAVFSQEKYGDGLFFLKKTAFSAAIGFAIMGIAIRIPYFYLKKIVYPLLIISLCFSMLILFSGLGVSMGGAKRWLHLGPITFQPSELGKIAIVIFMAYSLEKKTEKMEKFSVGVAPNIIIPGLITVFVLLGKDLGSACVMMSAILCMLYLGGAQWKHLAWLSLAGVPLLYELIAGEGYRMKRILTFLNPWGDRYGAGFQMIQSLLAFNEGGFSGKGLGAGQQKLFYLPEAHTDFIFSVLGEELGLLGVLFTIGLFLFFCYRGLKIANEAPDLFGRYLAYGVVILIGVQSLLNMGVVMGLLPTKGLVLPFIGYGGSALVTTLLAVGILLNVSTYQKMDTPAMYTVGGRHKA